MAVLAVALGGLSVVGAPAQGATGGTLAAGRAVSLAVSARTWVVAGASFPVAVTTRDAAGNVAPSYRGTVAFTSTDPRSPVLPAR